MLLLLYLDIALTMLSVINDNKTITFQQIYWQHFDKGGEKNALPLDFDNLGSETQIS